MAQFLCAKHRARLNQHPDAALSSWQRLMVIAQEKRQQNEWHDVALIYGNAFEIAGLLLRAEDFSRASVDRYMRTAIAFAHGVRKGSYPVDLFAVITAAKMTLVQHLSSFDLEKTLRPLLDVVHAPIDQVDIWMSMLMVESSQTTPTLH